MHIRGIQGGEMRKKGNEETSEKLPTKKILNLMKYSNSRSKKLRECQGEKILNKITPISYHIHMMKTKILKKFFEGDQEKNTSYTQRNKDLNDTADLLRNYASQKTMKSHL